MAVDSALRGIETSFAVRFDALERETADLRTRLERSERAFDQTRLEKQEVIDRLVRENQGFSERIIELSGSLGIQEQWIEQLRGQVEAYKAEKTVANQSRLRELKDRIQTEDEMRKRAVVGVSFLTTAGLWIGAVVAGIFGLAIGLLLSSLAGAAFFTPLMSPEREEAFRAEIALLESVVEAAANIRS